MKLSILNHDLAIDLGTANTVILNNDTVVVDEPSIVAVDTHTRKLVALGHKAQLMDEHVNPGIQTIRPLVNGVIADFDAAEMMMSNFIKMALNKRKSLITPNLKLVVGIPKGSTPVEMRAVRDSAEHAGARDLYLIYEPMASALGIGLDVEAPMGNMIVDIGGGTTEIAVISLGGIVESESVRIAGNELTNNIVDYVAVQHGVKIGRTTAEKIKFAVGSVLTELNPEDEPEPFYLRGKNIVTSLPLEVEITYQEIAHCLDKTISQIESKILGVLQRTPPELYSDIVENGIWLAGGGSLLRGIAQRFTEKVNIPFHVAEDPLRAVARGTCLALKNIDEYTFLMR